MNGRKIDYRKISVSSPVLTIFVSNGILFQKIKTKIIKNSQVNWTAKAQIFDPGWVKYLALESCAISEKVSRCILTHSLLLNPAHSSKAYWCDPLLVTQQTPWWLSGNLVHLESQNHTMLWVGRDLGRPSTPNRLPWAGTSSTRPGCSEPRPTWPWVFPGMGLALRLWAICFSVSLPLS